MRPGGNDPTWRSRASATLGLTVMAERAGDCAMGAGDRGGGAGGRRGAGRRSQAILFGSHAGGAHVRSDLDFLAIEPEVAESIRGSTLAAPLVRRRWPRRAPRRSTLRTRWAIVRRSEDVRPHKV